jgi:transcription elongation GreA/GreB family factor
MLIKFLVEQMAQALRQKDQVAQRAEADAIEAAKTLATESEKKEDGRVALEFGSLATGQGARSRQAREELQVLTRFYEGGLPRYGRGTPIGLGAVVDIAMDSERGEEERTFVLLPVGAGTELTGPGGDGYMTVITPASPVGKALLGRRAGETIEVSVRGEPVEWTITDVG